MSKNRTENPNIASDRIDILERDEIFVFGSNLAGHHMGGAARTAHKNFGAEWGVGVGLTGQSYAIPTMQGDILCHTDHAGRYRHHQTLCR